MLTPLLCDKIKLKLTPGAWLLISSVLSVPAELMHCAIPNAVWRIANIINFGWC
jgi:hypothetical protein